MSWRYFGFNAIRGTSTCLLCSVTVEGCNGQASPVAVTIRHDLQKRPMLAPRVPGHAACFRKLFGNSLNLVFSHIRFLQDWVKEVCRALLWPNVATRTACLVVRAWIWRNTVQREALDQIARAINDVEPPSVPFTQRRSVLSSEFLDSLKGMDQSSTNIRHFDATLIPNYFIAIGKIEVVA
jgi:hypothetical protein